MRNSIADTLRQIWVPKSFIQEGSELASVKSWLIDGNYYIDSNDVTLSLYVNNPSELKVAISNDAFKFASHAAQTVFELEKSGAYGKFTSWRIIKAYYAAFFAAHATLRLFGQSFSHLEIDHVNHIIKRSKSEANIKPDLTSGYYNLKFDENSKLLLFEKQQESHKSLWKCYLALLKDLSFQTLQTRVSPQVKEDLSNYLTEIADNLCKNGPKTLSSGNWLSHIRNEVNYKSYQGTWFPFGQRTSDFNSIFRPAARWRQGGGEIIHPNLSTTEMERFFNTSFSIINLCIIIFNDYSALLAEENFNASKTYVRLLNDSAAPRVGTVN